MVGGQLIIIQPRGWACCAGQCRYPEMTQREVMNFSTQNAKCINAKGVSDSRECHCGNGWIQWLGWTRLNTYTELSSRAGPRMQEEWITLVFSLCRRLQRTQFFGLVFTQPGTHILSHPCSTLPPAPYLQLGLVPSCWGFCGHSSRHNWKNHCLNLWVISNRHGH